MTTHKIEVGRPYRQGVRQLPQGAHYSYGLAGHELLLAIPSPEKGEVEAVRQGEAEFALFTAGSLVVLLYRLGRAGSGIPWGDAPYSWHLVPEERRDVPSADLEAGKRAVLSVHLVDAATGIVRALRLVSLSPELTRELHQAIRSQALGAWPPPGGYDAALDALYERHPTTESLLAHARARSKGGV